MPYVSADPIFQAEKVKTQLCHEPLARSDTQGGRFYALRPHCERSHRKYRQKHIFFFCKSGKFHKI